MAGVVPRIRLLAGLGNPGAQYEQTRHNAGFLCVDAVAERLRIVSETEKYASVFITAEHDGEKLYLLKPHTFMNRSGKAVLQAASFFKIKPEEILVAHDEVDLPPGKPRIKAGGGDGGHNGLKDITKMIGAKYHRLRLGVGRPVDPRFDTADYVLGKFTDSERETLDRMNAFFADRIGALLQPSEHAKLLSAYAEHVRSLKPAS